VPYKSIDPNDFVMISAETDSPIADLTIIADKWALTFDDEKSGMGT